MTAEPGAGGPADRPPRRVRQPARARAARLFRAAYGDSPLHLLILLASFALCGYAAAKLLAGDWRGIVEWFVGAAVIHDLLFVPLYGSADWVLNRGARAGRPSPAAAAPERSALRLALVNHVRVPAFLSLLLLLVYFPLILRRTATAYALTTRLSPEVFLGRWLLVTAALFGASALLFAVRWWRAGRPRRTGRGTASRAQSRAQE